MVQRCDWCLPDTLLVEYHDREWGVPQHDDRVLFEYLLLDGAQAGLSWLTVLRKRENYRRAFHGFDPTEVARYGEADVARLLSDPGIVRNRQKVRSAVGNARAFLSVQEEFGSFERYLWGFVDGETRTNTWRTAAEVPATSPEAEALSKDLRQRGFRFVGPVIIYAFMQSAGLVNDHVMDCFRHNQVSSSGRLAL